MFLDGYSSWGSRERKIDARAIKRVNQLLKIAENLGTNFCIFLVVILMALIPFFILSTDYENVIFYDGSNDICVMGKNGVIEHVRTK